MSITYGLAVYFMMWWILLFAALPFGVRTQAEEGRLFPVPWKAPRRATACGGWSCGTPW